MCLYQNRKLTNEEISLIKLSITEDNDFLDDFFIYINVPFLNSFCNCFRNSGKSAITINKSIYFSFDPQFDLRIDMLLLLHEMKHVLQCKEYGYCCLCPRYIYEIYKYGINDMYTTEGTLEYEAEEFAASAINNRK